MPKRDFLAIPDFTRDELIALFDLAAAMKGRQYREKPLAGKTLGMIFAKSSTRTRRVTSSSAAASRSATPHASSPAISTAS